MFCMDRGTFIRVMSVVTALYGVTVAVVAMASGGLAGPVAGIGGVVVGACWAIGVIVTRPAGGGRRRDRARNR